MNKFSQAMDFRHACKLFDDKRVVSDDDMHFILEAGRKSPSSFGLEPWHFVVITNPKIKELLRPACWDQPQITTASHVVVLLARKAATFKKGSHYLAQSFTRKTHGNAEKMQAVLNAFHSFAQNNWGERIEDWARMQVYIASANMMTAAAYIGIDSCPIEGFEPDKVEAILKSHTNSYARGEFNLAYILTFGYRTKPQSKQLRNKLSEIVEFIK